MSGLLGAIQFLTRVPVDTRVAVPHARVVPWFPVVGAMIGATVGGVAAALGQLTTTAVAAAVAIIVGLLVTGAFHEDGLADVADAFGGGWTREQRFEILKDSRHGTYGVAALASSLVVRVLALAALATPAAMFAGAVAAHVLGRSAAVAAMGAFPPATESGLGADAARSMRGVTIWATVLLGIALSAVATGWWVGPLAATAAVGWVAVGVLSLRKLGGIAGDVLGAIEQVVECIVLIAAAVLAERSGVWWAP